MSKVLRNTVTQLKDKPKKLFFIDSIGALITALLLFLLLSNFEEYVGMPKSILSYLSLIALLFCLFSATCFILLKRNFAPFIRGIGIANLIYCMLTIGILISNHRFVTIIGISYFLTEICVISILAYIELKVGIVG
ncbi:MAG: hypothetical protein RSF34_11120 [Flavobacterium sp.]|uniref:hypothetical protein n=1 Tax=Flavobacterium sp. TaxID=239 RepID=UPI002FC861CB